MSKKRTAVNEQIQVLDTGFWGPLRLRCIPRMDYRTKNAKRFVIEETTQNIWIPNRHLLEDGTIKTTENIDYVLQKGYRQIAIAKKTSDYWNHPSPGTFILAREHRKNEKTHHYVRASFQLSDDGMPTQEPRQIQKLNTDTMTGYRRTFQMVMEFANELESKNIPINRADFVDGSIELTSLDSGVITLLVVGDKYDRRQLLTTAHKFVSSYYVAGYGRRPTVGIEITNRSKDLVMSCEPFEEIIHTSIVANQPSLLSEISPERMQSLVNLGYFDDPEYRNIVSGYVNIPPKTMTDDSLSHITNRKIIRMSTAPSHIELTDADLEFTKTQKQL